MVGKWESRLPGTGLGRSGGSLREVTSALYVPLRSWQVKVSFQNFQVLRGIFFFDPGEGRQLFQEGLAQ